MCGFFFIKKNKELFSINKLEKYSNFLSHRGPDDKQSLNNNDIYAKFFRLSIQDISENGLQPMFDYTKRFMLLFNGEIYNYKSLKKELDFKNFKSNSDTEVLLYTLIEKGLESLKSIEGMFSFVLYDFKKKEVSFGRDRLGIKPLYYTKYNNSFLLSSEIKPLIPFQSNFKINDQAFLNFFFKGSTDFNQNTFVKNIFAVPSGQCGKINKNNIKFINYWNLKENIKKIKYSQTFNERKDKLNDLLQNSIQKHLTSDRKLGLFLSGGTDSNAMLNLTLGKTTDSTLQTFTYGFKDKTKYSEINRMKKITKSQKIVSNLSYLNPKDVINNFDKISKIIEGPFTSIRIFAMKNLYNLAKKKNCSVILEGDGGDEIFAGYDYNVYSYLKDKYKNNLHLITNDLLRFLKKSKKRPSQLLNLLITNNYQFASTSDGTPFVQSSFFNQSYLNKKLDEKFFFYKNINSFNNLQNSQIKDLLYIKLPRTLRYKDRLSMSEGVEARVPFLDHNILEYGLGLDNSDKFRNLNARYILKSLFIKNKFDNKKFEFSKRSIADPQTIWMKSHLKDFFLDNINSIEFKNLDYFNQKKIIDEFKIFCKNSNYPTSFPFFQILSFFIFFKVYKKHKFINSYQ